MKLEEHDLALSDYTIVMIDNMSNFSRKNLFYNKEKKIFINADFENIDEELSDSEAEKTIIKSGLYEVLSVHDVEMLEEATPENVKSLNPSWSCPKEKPQLDNHRENLGVMFGIVGIIGNVMIKGVAGWYVIKFKNGKKALLAEYSAKIKKIKKAIEE
jgi:hypothetical protein